MHYDRLLPAFSKFQRWILDYLLPAPGILAVRIVIKQSSLPGIVFWQTICTFINWLTEWVCFDNWSLTCVLKDSKILEDFYICYKCFYWNFKNNLKTPLKKQTPRNKLRLEIIIWIIMDVNYLRDQPSSRLYFKITHPATQSEWLDLWCRGNGPNAVEHTEQIL